MCVINTSWSAAAAADSQEQLECVLVTLSCQQLEQRQLLDVGPASRCTLPCSSSGGGCGCRVATASARARSFRARTRLHCASRLPRYLVSSHLR